MSTKTPLSEQSKMIGKQVTAAFENNQIEGVSFASICTAGGLSSDKVASLAELVTAGEYKRVGKRVAQYIDLGDVNIDAAMTALKVAMTAQA